MARVSYLVFDGSLNTAVCGPCTVAGEVCVADPDAPAASSPVLPAATETTRKPRKHNPTKQRSKSQSSPYQYGGREIRTPSRGVRRAGAFVGGRVPTSFMVPRV